jgi:hypothetical protein
LVTEVSTETGTPEAEIRIAICFFGITRSLSHTIESIEKNIFTPARSFGTVRIFAHFFNQNEVQNPRSGESGKFDAKEYELLNPDWVQLEEPGVCLAAHGFETLKAYGDSWDDGFKSLRNLVHQLHSLNEVTKAASEWAPDIVLFVRPDLFYHSSLGKHIATALKCESASVILPAWQNWRNGYNDRFAICRMPSAIEAYGTRVTSMHDFCRRGQGPLHSERLLRFVLDEAELTPCWMPTRASRMRIGGRLERERFASPEKERMRAGLRKIASVLGVRTSIIKLRAWYRGE